ncbi:MAG: helix-turn-helix transcriptional regulator [Proteobacteria bacterium]|nr:helix-turn-helix transcriptional regulator [Pseudomonadota bacterium]
MAKRSYRQNCALALTSDVIGERWSMLLIRDLMTGPKRYKELSRSLQGMGTNLLASRLRELEAAGIIARQDRGRGAHIYVLTDAGRALEPVILAMVRWGLTYLPDRMEGFYHQDDWDLVALKAAFEPQLSAGLAICTQFISDGVTAWVDIRDQQLTIGLGEADKADITINGTIEDLFVEAKDPAALLASGSPQKLNQFMSSFAL